MICWRITKYNPAHRNSSGAYLKDEWTSYSDIGKTFNQKIFTYEDYLKTETAYINAINHFMQCSDLPSLIISDLEKHKNIDKALLHLPDMVTLFNSIQNGKMLTIEEVQSVSQLVLREYLWCKLTSNNMYVHFGYDYYMYIGIKKHALILLKQ
jgi:hypothetical protein